MIEFLQHILDFRLIDLSLPIIASLALYVAYRQLKDIRKHQMIEFTYQLYRDFFNYLNDEKNKKQKDWLFGLAPSDIDEVKIGDLLEQFEALWSLQSKGLIDDDIANIPGSSSTSKMLAVSLICFSLCWRLCVA